MFPRVPAPASPPDRDTDTVGLRTVIAYKLIKGGAQLALALGLFGVVLAGRTDAIEGLATLLRHHVSGAWAVRAAGRLVSLATPRNVELTAVALLFDGVLSGVEGWALHTRRSWAEWLVVIASGSLLPYEIFALVRHARIGRGIVFLVNLVIVVYLARRALRRRRAEARDARPGPLL